MTMHHSKFSKKPTGNGLHNSTNGEELSGDPIVIVGTGCRLPGGVFSTSQLWDLLKDAKSAKSNVPQSRFRAESFGYPSEDRKSTDFLSGYFLNEDVRFFENSFFGISDKEATYMDPQQRKLLEVVYECFENAGHSLESVSGENIGCYIGNFTVDFSIMQTKEPEILNRYSATGMGTTLLSNRISHVFNLRGPSLVLDTACSSSLYSLHVACTALENDECSGAIVAGANLIMSPEQHLGTMKAGVLSPKSECHPFDADADGYGRGEGVAAIYIKKLSTAIRDGDPIRAVIRATAVNANGRTPGITTPSSAAQEEVIRKAHKKAGGIDFSGVGYVECHGTGTSVGDPIEAKALADVFSNSRPQGKPLLIGSVKSNLGHSEAASGISSILKVLLSFENNMIPPTVGIKRLNPNIKFDQWNLKVVTSCTPWAKDIPKIAGINSFGYGGANAHVIMESPESLFLEITGTKINGNGVDHLHTPESFLLPASASNELSLRAWLPELSQRLATHNYRIKDVAHTLGVRRGHMQTRSYIIGNQRLIDQGFDSSIVRCATVEAPPRLLAFIFTGQGSQWKRMGAELMSKFAYFRNTIRELDFILEELSPRPTWTIAELLSDLEDTALKSQVACTALQVALVRLLNHCGIRPSAVLGHSSGEIAAAYAAGFLTAREALLVAYWRGMVLMGDSKEGSMLVTDAEENAIRHLVKERNLSLVIACTNSPISRTLSGDSKDVDFMIEALVQQGFFARRLKTGGKAYHSPHMEALGAEYESKLAEFLQCSKTPLDVMMVSTVTGKITTEPLTAAYWRRNLESPVLFQQGFEELNSSTKYNYDWIEVGPHNTLELPIKQIREGFVGEASIRYQRYFSTLSRKAESTVDSIFTLLGELYLQGQQPDFSALNWMASQSSASVISDLPPYKWDHSSLLWSEPRASHEFRFRKHPWSELLGASIPGGDGIQHTWRNHLDPSNIPWLEDHKLQTTIVFPAAAYLVMVIEAVSQVRGLKLSSSYYNFRNVDIQSALVFADHNIIEALTTLHPKALSVSSVSKRWYTFVITSFKDGKSTQHCAGEVYADPEAAKGNESKAGEAGATQYTSSASSKQWYEKLAQVGLVFGEAFQTLRDVYTPLNSKKRIAMAKSGLRCPSDHGVTDALNHAAHVTTIDACLQTAIIASTAGKIQDLQAKIPTFIEQCAIKAPYVPQGSEVASIEASAAPKGSKSTIISASAKDISGSEIISMKNVRLTQYSPDTKTLQNPIERHPYLQIKWKPDISRLTYQGTDSTVLGTYLEEYMKAITLSGSPAFRKLLGILDLLAHKDPTMSILQLGGDMTASAAILQSLNEDTTFPRHKSYVMGEVSGDTVLGVDIKSTKDLGSIQKRTFKGVAFDAIILPEELTASKYLSKHFHVVKELLKPSGCLLAISSATDILKSHNLPVTMFHEEQTSDVVLAFQPLIEQAPIPSEVHIVYIHPENALQTILEMILKLYVKVHTHDIHEIEENSIPRKAAVISLLELETSFLNTLNDDQLRRLQYVTDNAGELVWVASGGILRGKKPEFSLAYGFARALALEQPALKISVFDLDTTFEDVQRTALNIIGLFCKDDNYSIRDVEYAQDDQGCVHISRFEPVTNLNEQFRERSKDTKVQRPVEEVSPVRVAIEQPGMFDTLFFEPTDVSSDDTWNDRFVEVAVKAIGLNAKDVYALGGRVDTRDSTYSLECAGVVTMVGSKTSGILIGDRVVVMAPGHFQTVERFPEWSCQKLKPNESFKTMSTLPVAYATALYGLCDRAKLAKDEKVLIHSGCGGVGMAAIEIAQLCGAEVFVTVGTKEKVKFLHERFRIPFDHIFSSRDSSFAEELLKVTEGYGADVILNSLTGDLLHDSWSCCAPFGRFIEIGKRDIETAGRLDMTVFSRNATFSAFDLSELYHSRSSAYQATWLGLLQRVLSLYRCRKIGEIEISKVFDVGDLTSAFRHFNSSARIGKIAITFEDGNSLIKIPLPKYTSIFNEDKVYMFIGGLGGLGRSLTRWMISRGARRFIFLSPSGTSKPATQRFLTELQEMNVTAKVVKGSVTNKEDVEASFAACDGRVGGIVQGAMALRESLFTNISANDWRTCIEPKVQGTLNIHECLSLSNREDGLEFFLLLSSVSGSVGTATESNYCAGNGFLDAFAKYRRSVLGKPATSVGLGMISEIGYLHENPEVEDLLLRKGIHSLTEKEFLQVVDLALMQGADDINCAHLLTGLEPLGLKTLWDKGFDVSNQVLKDSRAVLLASAFNANKDQHATLKNLEDDFIMDDAEDMQSRILYLVKKQFSTLLLVPVERLNEQKPVASYGMDSMISAEMRTWLYQKFGVDVAFFELLSKTETIASVAERVIEKLKYNGSKI